MFIKDSKIVILIKRGYEEEKENKIQGFSKKFLLCGVAHQNLGN
jgi:hypothetical protein